jgi:hypothetical protein
MRQKEQWTKWDIRGMEPRTRWTKWEKNRSKTRERWTKQDINGMRWQKSVQPKPYTQYNDTHHNEEKQRQNTMIISMTTIHAECYAGCYYCWVLHFLFYAECHYTERWYAECRGAPNFMCKQ